ncbi:MAG: hypothetical protein ACOYVF_00795 [Candidatus Zixiibacteriota bacterium]
MKQILVFLLLLILPATASSLGWFNISRATLQQLDADTYRLRVHVNFGGENFFSGLAGTTGSFNHFSLGLLGTTQYLPTLNTGHITGAYSTPGEWSAGVINGTPQTFLTYEFGYDFNLAQPLSGPVNLDYSATFNNIATTNTTLVTDVTFEGEILAGEVPENETLLLFGFGLTILGIWVYFRKMN